MRKFVKQSIKDVISGIVGGLANVIVGQPFDTIKVKLQSDPVIYKDIPTAIKKTWKDGGIPGFYAGSSPAVATALLENAILFFAFGHNKNIVQYIFKVTKESALKPWQIGIAGGMSGFFTALVVSPLELFKCQLQVYQKQSQENRLSIRDIARMTYREEGMNGFFRGLVSTWLRDIPGYLVFFFTKTQIKAFSDSLQWNSDFFKSVLPGGASGVTQWIVSFPWDTGKTRIQTKTSETTSPFRTVYDIATNEGAKSLYKGLTPALARAFPSNAALWLARDKCLQFLNCMWP